MKYTKLCHIRELYIMYPLYYTDRDTTVDWRLDYHSWSDSLTTQLSRWEVQNGLAISPNYNSNYIHIYYKVLACMAFDWKPDCTRHLNEWAIDTPEERCRMAYGSPKSWTATIHIYFYYQDLPYSGKIWQASNLAILAKTQYFFLIWQVLNLATQELYSKCDVTAMM